MKTDKPSVARAAIADAALRCFERFGVHRTSMADVGEAAGVSRQTLYRLFDSRPALLEYIVVKRITTMGEDLRPYFASSVPLREALVEGSLLSIRVGEKDALFREIVEKSGEHRLDQFLLQGTREIQALMLSLWSPLLDRARAAGELRPGVDNELAVEWIRNVHGCLMLRDDYDEARRRQVLTTFFVPSLMEPAKAEA